MVNSGSRGSALASTSGLPRASLSGQRGLAFQGKASALITTLGILISHASILDSRTNDCTNDYVRHAGPERQFSRAGRLH